jgi:hypothetical protein
MQSHTYANPRNISFDNKVIVGQFRGPLHCISLIIIPGALQLRDIASAGPIDHIIANRPPKKLTEGYEIRR